MRYKSIVEIHNENNVQMSVDSENNLKKQNKKSLRTEEIVNWLISYMALLLEIEPNQIDPQASFSDYGLDSAAAASLISDLQDFSGYSLEATLLYNYPTINDLGQHLSERFENLASASENI